ncbi:TetR/AcrR family transcriptional regulator [Stieleria sp. JC731]|uniref:TetR/AcrR family transcriptional regulator n=1 Tax=Pirellulaceae TaxID=2691357 RepID=UPI001E50A815|nr:TetR/AcrR family transcriptional regulator [Stieleria sp. JC731]MCC9600886.1 TetR/AcrR family transcriptional regulator [Stieleria sp. JC731]
MKHSDRKRADILAAAVSEFRTYGYDNTSMDRIADAAGASKRTVYNHFGSKEQMFEAMVREMMQRTDVLQRFAYQSDQPLPKQLKAIANEILGVIADESYRDLARVVLSRLTIEPEYSVIISEHSDRINSMLADWMTAAHRDKQLEVPHPELAADQFVGMLMSYGFWPAIFCVEKKSIAVKRTTFINQTVKMFLKGYGKPE